MACQWISNCEDDFRLTSGCLRDGPKRQRNSVRCSRKAWEVSDFRRFRERGALTIFGAVPSDFTARPRPGTSGRYSFKVQSDANTEAVSVSGEFISPKWTLRWHQWDRNPDNLDGPSADAWDKMLAGPVLYEETRHGLRSNFGIEPPAPGVPASFCALVATAELSLAGGEYEFECVNDGGGYVIRVGNRVVLALACPGHVNRRFTRMALPAGTYPVRVEAFHVVDNGVLDLRIAPAQADRQTP